MGDLTVGLRGARVLVVEDEEPIRRWICRALSRAECAPEPAASAEEALSLLAASRYDVALIDVRLPVGSGEEVLARVRDMRDAPAVVMMSGAANVDTVVRAMRNGATDFVEKPFPEPVLLERVLRAVEGARARRDVHGEGTLSAMVVGDRAAMSPAMQRALALADRVAGTPNSSALLLGESGVGKEVLAAYIHAKSTRSGGPFVRVNVAAIPESMIEAELFGSVKGAFTDSKQARAGHFASAHEGTLLLDEIGELRVDHQPKLLRVLEERRFFPMGSDRERAVDVRFLAATNVDPEEMIARGTLRRDLFYRLGIVVRIPPLRERVAEILPLARQFIVRFCVEFARSPMHLSPAAERGLLEHTWPGNIRELRNAIERSVMTTIGNEIGLDSLDIAPPEPPSGTLRASRAFPIAEPTTGLSAASRAAVEQVERQRIVDVLATVGGSRSRAAVVLGVSRSTLYEKLKRYQIE